MTDQELQTIAKANAWDALNEVFKIHTNWRLETSDPAAIPTKETDGNTYHYTVCIEPRDFNKTLKTYPYEVWIDKETNLAIAKGASIAHGEREKE